MLNRFGAASKPNWLDGGNFRNLTEARLEISYYLACYSNEHRYSAYLAPNHIETHFQTAPQLCAA